jgi:hypothetical protein
VLNQRAVGVQEVTKRVNTVVALVTCAQFNSMNHLSFALVGFLLNSACFIFRLSSETNPTEDPHTIHWILFDDQKVGVL